jgi:GNAT superfamily N-acetyltransferase
MIMNTLTQVMIGEEDYLFVKQYQDNEEYRSGLNLLTRQTFGFDFEGWYQQDLWTDRYRPYSLVHKNRIVANVSVNPIDFVVEGKLYQTLQIGTVMTDTEYRNKGLSRVLFDIVMEEYDGKVDLMYLYANATVRQFYPKFGFMQAQEHIYSKQYTKNTNHVFRKLDGTNTEDRQLLLRLISNTKPLSKNSMVNNPYLPMFYLSEPLAECCYYCDELDLAAVVEYEEDGVLVDDFYCSGDFDMDEVIASLLDRDHRKVILGFTPQNTASFHCDLLQEHDTTFFVKGSNFVEKGRLPILSHA